MDKHRIVEQIKGIDSKIKELSEEKKNLEMQLKGVVSPFPLGSTIVNIKTGQKAIFRGIHSFWHDYSSWSLFVKTIEENGEPGHYHEALIPDIWEIENESTT